ncbi:MAG: hypothetical protein AB7F59_14145 [Bdellovibrionales bacterium]
MNLSKISFIGLLVLIFGCAKTSAPQTPRTYLEKENSNVAVQNLIPHPFENSEQSACQRLEELQQNFRANPRAKRFSLLTSLYSGSNSELIGSTDLSAFPLAQIIIPQKMNLSSEQFFKAAEQEYMNGTLGTIKWNLLWSAWQTRVATPLAFNILHAKALNEKTEEVFPGVFGQAASLEKSFMKLLFMKMNPGTELVSATFLTQPASLTSSLSNQDALTSLSAAVKSSQMSGEDVTSRKERICALVLWQRAFAQLLNMKGYVGVSLTSTSGSPVSAQAKKLSMYQTNFSVTSTAGSFIESDTKNSVVLEEKDIAEYAPTEKKSLELSQDASLSHLIQTLEGLVYTYQATSPSAPWVRAQSDYLLGDITSTSSRAILPAEAHALSCGLVTILLKNLSTFHIQKVNAKGQLLKADEAAAGMILTEKGDKVATTMKLRDLLRLVRSVIYLDLALSYHADKNPQDLEKMNPLYSRKKLAQLVGTKMFSSSELDALLSSEEKASVLADKLKELRLPLGMLLSKFRATKSKSCVQVIQWNLASGKTESSLPCNDQLSKEYSDVIELMSRYTQSTILL